MADEVVPNATVFSYKKPEVEKGKKKIEVLARATLASASIHAFNGGGENNLHSHPHTDEVWYVLSGKIRFYTTNDELVGEFGQNEGILIPGGYPYWFEAGEDNDGQAEIIRFGAAGPEAGVEIGVVTDPGLDRVALEPVKPSQR